MASSPEFYAVHPVTGCKKQGAIHISEFAWIAAISAGVYIFGENDLCIGVDDKHQHVSDYRENDF